MSTLDVLSVTGNAGDVVNAQGDWTDGGEADGYHLYTLGEAQLRVETDVTVNIVV
jgi:hypothetical protein